MGRVQEVRSEPSRPCDTMTGGGHTRPRRLHQTGCEEPRRVRNVVELGGRGLFGDEVAGDAAVVISLVEFAQFPASCQIPVLRRRSRSLSTSWGGADLGRRGNRAETQVTGEASRRHETDRSEHRATQQTREPASREHHHGRGRGWSGRRGTRTGSVESKSRKPAPAGGCPRGGEMR